MATKLHRIGTITTILRYTILIGTCLLLALPWRPIAPIIIIIATSVHTWRHGNTARSSRLFDITTSTARVERQMSNC